MAQNTFKTPPRPPRPAPRPRANLFQLIESYARLGFLFDGGLPVKYMPQVAFLALVALVYIGNTHFAERTIRKLDKAKTEVDELRADYTTLKSDYMLQSTQSSVAERVKELGLQESKVPPTKVIVPDKPQKMTGN